MRRHHITKKDIREIFHRLKTSWEQRRLKREQTVPEVFISRDVMVEGNRLVLFNRGLEVYEIMLELMANARREILIDSYVFSSDALGQRFKEVLLQKEKEGVQIRIIFDPVGSIRALPQFWRDFRRGRIRIKEMHPYKKLWNLLSLKFLYRDHRKLVVIDNKVALIGGLNISKEYESNWRDTHMLIQGGAVRALRPLFYEVYHTKSRYAVKKRLLPEDLGRIFFLNSFPGESKSRLRDLIVRLVNSARKEIIMSQLYFVPDRRIVASLNQAVKRGVNVKLILSEFSDIGFVHRFVMTYIQDLLRHGIEVWWYQPCINHSKTLLVDQTTVLLGSANLSHWSLFRTYESVAVVHDAEVGRELYRMNQEDLKFCRRETIDHWQERGFYASIIDRLLVPLRVVI